jgi:hypothetical protein
MLRLPLAPNCYAFPPEKTQSQQAGRLLVAAAEIGDVSGQEPLNQL